jgi:NAD(P)-dependent dehydrogenase (short-subunit alcohol dehydrogenase family)
MAYREDLMATLAINVNAPHNVTRAVLPLIRKGGKKMVINM